MFSEESILLLLFHIIHDVVFTREDSQLLRANLLRCTNDRQVTADRFTSNCVIETSSVVGFDNNDNNC